MSVPDLQPVDTPPPEALAALGASLPEFRSHFQRFLLEWFRAPTDTAGLSRLGRLFQQVQGALPAGPLADLFQLAEAYLALLQHGEVAVEAASQALMGRLDRVLKPLATTPPHWPETDIGVLTDAFLAEFSRVGAAPARVAEIRTRRRGAVAAPTWMPLALVEPLVESADRWLEARTRQPEVTGEVDRSPEVADLPDLGMGWEAAVLGSVGGAGGTDEPAQDPFAGLGLVIAADALPELPGPPSDLGNDTGALDALLADASAGLGTLPTAAGLPELIERTPASGEEAEMTLDALADSLAGLGSEPVAGPLPDLFLEPGPGAAAIAPLATVERPAIDGDALAADLGQALDSLVGLPTDVIEPLPEIVPPGEPIGESRPTAAMAPLPLPTPSGALEPIPAPVIGIDPRAELRPEPATRTQPIVPPVRPQSRPRAPSDSRERTLDTVAEIGLNCARLAQRNGLMGCGLAEYDLALRHLRQQLRGLESAAEADQVPRLERGLSGADRMPTLGQGLRDLSATLAQLVGLRDQLGVYQRESAELLAQQTRLADALQDGLANVPGDGGLSGREKSP